MESDEHDPVAERKVGHAEDLLVRHQDSVPRKVKARAAAATAAGLQGRFNNDEEA